MPIRVLHVIESLGYAGVETVVMNFYRQINKDKIQFDFVICTDESDHFRNEILELGGKIYCLPSRARKPFNYMAQLEKVIRKNEYKIIHIHKNSASIAMDAFVAKKCKVPVIIGHSHNSFCNILWQHYLLKPFVNLFLTQRFACFEDAGKWVFGNRDDVKIIQNGVDTDIFKFNEKQREKYREDFKIKDKLVVGYVGRLHEQKNIDRLIEIFQEVSSIDKNTVLLIVGSGPLAEVLQEKANFYNADIRFLGQRDDINNLMSAMDVFVMASLYEGLPLVAVEAQASGLSLVVSDNTHTPNITNNIHVLSLDEDNSKWCEQILKGNTMNRHDAALRMQKSGFNIKEEVHYLEEFYLKQQE